MSKVSKLTLVKQKHLSIKMMIINMSVEDRIKYIKRVEQLSIDEKIILNQLVKSKILSPEEQRLYKETVKKIAHK